MVHSLARSWPHCAVHLYLSDRDQAEALADALADTTITVVHCSDLLRAKTTANALKTKQKNNEHLVLCESTSLREQNFGAGEGKKFSKREPGVSLAEHYSRGKFPALHNRQERFPDGESLDDVAKRAEEVINDILIPHILQEGEDGTSRTVAIVSHGIFIIELVAAVIRRDNELKSTVDIHQFRGMKNTAWTKLDVTMKSSDTSSTATVWSIKIAGINQDTHLLNLHRQRGGIGSMAHDPRQLDIRGFLGKKTAAPKPTRVKPY